MPLIFEKPMIFEQYSTLLAYLSEQDGAYDALQQKIKGI